MGAHPSIRKMQLDQLLNGLKMHWEKTSIDGIVGAARSMSFLGHTPITESGPHRPPIERERERERGAQGMKDGKLGAR